MTDPTHPSSADLGAEAANPATAAARLAEIAAAHPELQAVVAANPTTYPGLLDWLGQVGDDHTKATVAWVRSGGHQAAAAHAARLAAEAAAAAHTAQAPQAPSAPEPFAAPAATAAPPPPAAPAPAAGPAPTPTAAPFPQQPPSPYPSAAFASAAQPFGYPAADPYATAPGGDAGTGAPRPKKSKKWLFIGIAAGLVVLLAGGGVFAYVTVFSKLGGAGSPEASVDKLFDGVASLDAVSIYGAISPSEIGTLTESFDSLKDLQTTDDDGDTVDYAELVKAITDNSSIELSDMEYESEEIEEGISKVTITGGSLHVEADADAVADAYSEIVRAQMQSQAELYGYSESEIDGLIEEARASIVTQIEDSLPYDVDAAEIEDSLGQPLSLMSVKEGGNWYVSPLLTAGEYALSASGGTRGELVDPAQYGSPEEAFQGILDGADDAIANGDFDTLSASLPLAERRFVSLYAAGIAESSGFAGSGDGFSVDTLEVTPEVSGDIARIAIDQLVISMEGYSEGSFEISGVCATVVTEYSEDSGCLTDVPQAAKLGLDEAKIVAVQENGSWFVSPLSTLSDVGSIVSEHLVQLSNDGELEDLFK